MDISLLSSNNDDTGPEILVYTSNGRIVSFGDHLNPNSMIYLEFSDQSGINITSEPGHEIKLVIANTNVSMDLTNQFIYNQNDITKGTIKINLSEFILPLRAEISCWDNANNSNSKTLFLKPFSQKFSLF